MLVTTTGRVVLVDFGLVQDMNSLTAVHPKKEKSPHRVHASRQAEAGARQRLAAPSASSFQALTGRLPLRHKNRLLAESALNAGRFEHGPDRAADLIELCQKLLERTPARRPTGMQVRDLRAPPTQSRSSVF